MKNKLTLIALVLAATSLHARVRAHFPDGTAIEIFTQTTGSTKIDSGGGIGLMGDDIAHRFITDENENILFGYLLHASRGANPNTVSISIEPMSAADQKEWLTDGGFPIHSAKPTFPTVAAVRDFPEVKIDQVVTLDILFNPSTGEKIYDVLRPVIDNDDPTLDTSRMTVRGMREKPTISLKQIMLRVNSTFLPIPASWVVGSAVRIEIPGYGLVIVAAQNPHSDKFGPYAPTARADGKKLTWKTGNDTVEITSETDILSQSKAGDLWVYTDRTFKSPATIRLQSADTADSLMPGATK
jgi:hypothetical protein